MKYSIWNKGGLMVTTLRLSNLVYMAPKNVFTGESWRPEVYMEALRATGFSDVRMENITDQRITFQVIVATASK